MAAGPGDAAPADELYPVCLIPEALRRVSNETRGALRPAGGDVDLLCIQAQPKVERYTYNLTGHESRGTDGPCAARWGLLDRFGLDVLFLWWLSRPGGVRSPGRGWVNVGTEKPSGEPYTSDKLAMKLRGKNYASLTAHELSEAARGQAPPTVNSWISAGDSYYKTAPVSTSKSGNGIPDGVPNDGSVRRFACLELAEEYALLAETRPELRLIRSVHLQTGI